MKKIFCLLLSVLILLPAYGQESEVSLIKPITISDKEKKSFAKFSEKVGLLKMSELEGKQPSEFWDYIMSNNKRWNVYMKAVEKRTKMAKNTAQEVVEATERHKLKRPSMELNLDGDVGEYITQLESEYKEFLGEKSVQIEIIAKESINAFACADGYIGINSGCIVSNSLTNDEIAYLLGHECTHYRLSHLFVHKYFQKKQDFKVNMIAGISSAAIAASAVYSSTMGYTDTTSIKSIGKIVESAEELKDDLYFKFSREEEFEADAYSMYYLINRGISPLNAINTLLKYVDLFGDAPTEKDDSHPSSMERAKFLYYVLTEYNKE